MIYSFRATNLYGANEHHLPIWTSRRQYEHTATKGTLWCDGLNNGQVMIMKWQSDKFNVSFGYIDIVMLIQKRIYLSLPW